MKDISGKELYKILKQSGWELKTIKGSHHVYIRHRYFFVYIFDEAIQ